MSTTVKNLWPELPTAVLAPAVILRQQVDYFNQQAKGAMKCDLVTNDLGNGAKNLIQHELAIRSDAIGYSHSILTATHDYHRPYPVEIESDAALEITDDYTNCVKASTEAEFTELLSKILHSKTVKSVLNAIAARINAEK